MLKRSVNTIALPIVGLQATGRVFNRIHFHVQGHAGRVCALQSLYGSNINERFTMNVHTVNII